jgi:hypothetical protein
LQIYNYFLSHKGIGSVFGENKAVELIYTITPGAAKTATWHPLQETKKETQKKRRKFASLFI